MCPTVEKDVVMLNIFPGNPRHANMCKSMNIEQFYDTTHSSLLVEI